MKFRELDGQTLVAGQIDRVDLFDAAALGVAVVINNRPDGEEIGQPASAEIEAAARTAGLAYRHIPVAGGFSEAQVAAMAEALDRGKALAFCRSGTRSTFLWALARGRLGDDGETLAARAAAAGYDLAPIRHLLG